MSGAGDRVFRLGEGHETQAMRQGLRCLGAVTHRRLGRQHRNQHQRAGRHCGHRRTRHKRQPVLAGVSNVDHHHEPGIDEGVDLGEDVEAACRSGIGNQPDGERRHQGKHEIGHQYPKRQGSRGTAAFRRDAKIDERAGQVIAHRRQTAEQRPGPPREQEQDRLPTQHPRVVRPERTGRTPEIGEHDQNH
ncbi:hypothetical protein D9M72_560150 [compost metagenome]